jgi:hypothetical protein
MLGVGAANRKTERRRNVIRHRSVGLREMLPRILWLGAWHRTCNFGHRQSAFEPQQSARQWVCGVERALSTCSSGGSPLLIISL